MEKVKKWGQSHFKNPNVIPVPVLWYMAWRNLTHKKLRAFLTIFGVTVGIGAIFFLLSFGIGLQRLVTNEVIGNQSIKVIDATTPNSKILKLDNKIKQRISDLPRVVRVGASYSYAGSLKLGGGEVDSIVYGVDDNHLALSNFSLADGRLITAGDNDGLVTNYAALRALGLKTDKSALGKKIAVRIPLPAGSARATEIIKDFKIVGILPEGAGSEIFVPGHVFQTAGVNTYNDMKIEAKESEDVASLRKQIESMGFQTVSPIDTIDQINEIFKFFNIILAGFGGIGMIVAVLGMFNTLTISLLERTREIGLMIALGGRNWDMRRLFILEAVLLSVVGAASGIVLAFIGGQIINFIMNQFAAKRGVTDSFSLFATPPLLVIGVITFMVLVGLAVAYLPARRAARINPIDALRRE
jgi:ABC-type antimicrobial peptide transport system permease subunit